MPIVKLFLIITLLLLAAPVALHAEVIDRIAAVVNDEPITNLEVDRELSAIRKEAEKNPSLAGMGQEEQRQLALGRVVDKKLVEQKIRELEIKVGEEEVRQAIEDVKKQNNLSQDALIGALASQGLSFDQYKAQLKEQLERLRLVSQEVRSKIQVGDKDVQEYYDANAARFSTDEKFHARHIFFKLGKNPTSREIKDAMNRAMTVMLEVKSGGDFVALAKKYSDDPNAATDGGDLGTFRKGDMLPEIEDTVIKMKPGEVSELVITASGFHIIKLEEIIPGTVRPLAEVKGEIEELLYRKKSEERFNQWVSELKKNASIDIRQ
jgi:peptidyl-prolyl cis-trans isomerase SurA